MVRDNTFILNFGIYNLVFVQDLEFRIQNFPYRVQRDMAGDCVLFAERANEFDYTACLSPSGVQAQRKRVLKERLLCVQDPKRDELTMSRMKDAEMRLEVRTRESCNPLG